MVTKIVHEIFINPQGYNVDVREIEDLIRNILEKEGAPSTLSIELTFTDDEYIKALNLKYRDRDQPTDCLCFVLQDVINKRKIADIYISYQRAEEQAKERKRSLGCEIVTLAAHSTLHALGYEEGRLMEGKQKEYLIC
ncbi:rRNA maturation RNase YbeY [candidate division WOR-3 bacterium]|nr:rRNA maturation RNase YbeY [candidate division WOR-3 bacterium]